MITKRIIPCLDVRSGRVVKGTNFEGIKDVADPVEMARMYNAAGADELVFYDITASAEGRALFTDILTRVASEVFIPLTVGGGINTLEDFDRVLKCGADKVSVNSGAIRNPGIIPAAAQKYGNQCVVLSADIKRVDGKFMLFAKGGRENTGIDALDWLERLPFTLAFVCGNHENYDALARYPVAEWRGGKVHCIRPHVLHLMRGQIFELEGTASSPWAAQKATTLRMGFWSRTPRAQKSRW